ncbi:LysR family transcriptional regulator [Bradyrhizobium japonicum]|uniref:LysR family transcriptional regulator n=1 Tax=Bradyrhizobium japonicum TaxID=375 RepID=UPI001BAB6851|nr:LysR family transcriptional regulator [Bradyrhizobium japonicum]MBR0914398.1 LysR family transcriptional regulator [Bradyrhizobium japonicum]MCP1768640.1 DNA-binding transcriptional LysR family regulator [Bradyrhizobium japonicum]MCP1794310.1 DNA-binding transcriptional LysR family regulator [Bradyrhizobium japonicum]MCP1810934.1 DNA-binding transcriptional LysR family regulator [Bradyrhizobium japonicum]MCP1821213.1 DNA-binding transcriptional LysR family regulator [Bradyrhizobium japonicu
MSPDKYQDKLEVGENVPKLSLRQLTYFLATANRESVLRAAETLNVSSASISTAIAQMEEFLQVQLFVRRHARGLVLTSAGQDLAAHARNILLHAREIESVAQRGPYKAVGRINIGCLTTIAPYLIPLVLKEVAANHPEIQLRWREDKHEALLDGLHSGGFDLIIVYDYDIPTTLHLAPLRPMPVQVVLPVSHPLAHNQRCSLLDLIDEPMVLLDQPRTRDYFLSLFASKGLTPKISQRTDSFEMVRSLVANGFGYSLLNFVPPYHVVGHGKLISRPLPDVDRSQNLVLGRLYRFRAPRLVDELYKSISAAVQMLEISAT